LDLIVNLFHYKSGSDEYGVEAAKYGHKPLYVKTAGGAGNTMLNEVFCYIVSKLGDFQNLRHHAPRSMEEVETFVTSEFPAVPSTKHHIELPTTSYVSKHFVAYIEALVGAAPYFRTTDPRMKLDARFAKALSEFNKQDDLRFDQYVEPKLQAWFSQFPPTPRVAGAAADDDAEGVRAAREGLGRRVRVRRRRRPMPCLETNKYC
jgi:hypothetical protein